MSFIWFLAVVFGRQPANFKTAQTDEHGCAGRKGKRKTLLTHPNSKGDAPATMQTAACLSGCDRATGHPVPT